ncbi:MAG: Rne/Rng family ribonuclease [Candidatus Babeliales bacterium]
MKKPYKKIIINVNPWQTRIAILNDLRLQNIYFEAHAKQTLERSFFKGVVTKVLPGIQTAFIDIGQEKAGFLHISEIDRELMLQKMSKTVQLDDDKPPTKKPTRSEPVNIKNILREKDSILIQVNKEPIFDKGAKLTTCYTLPGRFIVLMPNIPRIGISKKISDQEERARLKMIVRTQLPSGMGAIIRTTAEGKDASLLEKDISFLIETWNKINLDYEKAEPREKIYEDLELSLQIIRDYLDEDIEHIITDDQTIQNTIYSFIQKIAPAHTHKVLFFKENTDIFLHYNIEQQIEESLRKRVQLASGGYLIIEFTEAMTVIDVNTGRFIGKVNLEDTIFKTNFEAAEEIVRQLCLLNIGGLIVIDFIDMATTQNKQALFNFFYKMLRTQDKLQSFALEVSEFGLVEMTRKRSGKTLVQELTSSCPQCSGTGFVPSATTVVYKLLRELKHILQTIGKQKCSIILEVNIDIFNRLTTIEYNSILYLQTLFGYSINIIQKNSFTLEQYTITKK